MHRYRVREISKKDQGTRYILVDESGHYRYRVTLEYDYEAQDRFEKATFETPEEAWASLGDEPCIPTDTPLYRYTFYPKGGGVSFECISKEMSADSIRDNWIALKTIDDEYVHISLVELLRFTRKEI